MGEWLGGSPARQGMYTKTRNTETKPSKQNETTGNTEQKRNYRTVPVSKLSFLRSLNCFKVVPFETNTQRLRLLANFKIRFHHKLSVSKVFKMQMFENVLTFLRYHFIALYSFLLPWSLHCLRRRFHVICFKFPGICKPSVTGYAIVCSLCVLM